MRPDPHMERARELCIAAGVDPDSRVGEGRGMPAWCLYRDAAQKEKMARELDAIAEGIATHRPQDARFQSAPLKVFGTHDAATLAQMRNCMAIGNVVGGVVCADGHLGYAQPVGGVIAYEKQISISGVGFDIGCGNMAVRLDTTFAAIEDRIGEIVHDIARVISFGIGRSNSERVEHDLFDDGDAWKASDMEAYRSKALTQLGTVGSGNHYVDLMRDEAGHVWIGVHFGSRGLGHTSATHYLKAAGGKDGMNVRPAVIDEDSELGRRYIAAMELAGRYSYAGREWVVERVRRIIGGAVTDMVHNHHNYAWRETHGGVDLWVVRKGATPAFPGQRGFVGGSMGDDAVIIEGVDSADARASFYSTVHGAGRLFGRKEAKRRFTREAMDGWLRERGVTLIGADLDESPMAYRRLPEVIAEHAGTVRVLHTLRPFAVVMAGEGEFDPFKD
ncbi:RtcB family protein [Bradyrhizobium sp. U87765 SZCCT0131]|uniref:RtcB family protein n=1 Tax=unclassified Bradyrhizobium TaxID=2631580 RepID=UPI001BA53EF3|nr:MULTISPECIES: RtcB family protein [unclassified Bradyrhizobium]MBR1218939.1 RtcB family protein [Bradyrhizobium sp. U87765 SZCCT0131]MBR1261590.1 RtcB family protein [Bradyrhizobium sp. U87765 SZCCT0134]MBR1306557.1 RtcB family protein [Bradyrhizobium sp. U87765 SZCCT0110]MBR1317372.1 RtcB family protein [Bradyrhizobium sp. U87765 SZCCT0109]MBR1351074.1 RtcB family protein [Bradyrhizobium sp. U87765 SZCCT0048]